MKQLIIQLNLAIALLLAFSFHCWGADNYTLEFNLEKGKTYKHTMASDMNMTMDIMGQDMVIDVKSEICIHYDVVDQTNDVYDIRMTYQKMKFDISAPPAPITFDSESPENSSDRNVGEIIKSLMGIPFDVQLTKQGKVVSVKGIEKLTEVLNTISNEQYKQMLNQQISEKSIQQTIEQSSSYFPGKPVAINDNWDVTLNLNTGGIDIIHKMNLTLKQVKDNIATLEVAGTITTPEGGAVMNIQGMDATVTANGKQAGTIQLDLNTGWVVCSEATQNSIQEIEVMGQIIQQIIKAKSTISAD